MARAALAFTQTLILPYLRHRTTTLLYSNNFLRFNSTGSLNSPTLRLINPVHAHRTISSIPKQEPTASITDLQFEGRLKIVEYPDPILRAKNKKVNIFDETLKKLVDEMFDVMYKTEGVGLAAPQVGINVQVMVFNPAGERCEGEEIVLVNPRVLGYSKEIVPFEEGCLSFPEIYADVERPDSLKVEAQDITGARFEVNLTELPARVFQHEYDHLQGILFIDQMSDEVIDSIHEDLQDLEKKYEERTGLPSSERIDNRRKRKKAVGFGKSQLIHK